MDNKDREKLLDVAGFLQGWLAFKKPVPPDEVVRLHFDLVMEVLAKNNEVLDLVSKSVEVGDKVKIIANKSSHGFSVGDYCVVNYKNELGDGWEIYANNEIWDLNEDEFTVC